MKRCPIVWSIGTDGAVVQTDDVYQRFECQRRVASATDIIRLLVDGTAFDIPDCVVFEQLLPHAELVQITRLLADISADIPVVINGAWPSMLLSEVQTIVTVTNVPFEQQGEVGQIPTICFDADVNDGQGATLVSGDTRLRFRYSSIVADTFSQGTSSVHQFAALCCALSHGYDLLDSVTVALSYRADVIQSAWPTAVSQLPSVETIGEQAVALNVVKPQQPFARCDTEQLGIYPVVDSVEWVERLLNIGVKTLQLRIKDHSEAAVEAQIKAAIELGHRFEARLFINDYWRLALKHGAYGVHLGQEDIEVADLDAIQRAGIRLGLSTHGFYEIANAHQLGPTYIALGHIFPTPTKQMPSAPQGLERLSRYAQLLRGDYPTVAIGGIDIDRAKLVAQTGVGSIAVVRAITLAEDPKSAFEQLTAILADAQEAENGR